MLKKIMDFYLGQNCVRMVDIQTHEPTYVSLDEAEQFATRTPIQCFNCQQFEHTKAKCTNEAALRAKKIAGCSIC